MGLASWLLIFAIAWSILIYNRASINVFTLASGLLLFFVSYFTSLTVTALTLLWFSFFLIFVPFRISAIRYRFFSRPALVFYRKVMPTMSRTEKEALNAGTVGFEGELFCGNPNWNTLLSAEAPRFSAEEKAFLAGPVETLCAMANDWDITHSRLDLPKEMWHFIKEQKFFGLIIPKKYGGLNFSACAVSQIFTKLYGCSPTIATTVSVPNSLGPAELLLHYGTEQQKNYYLPRLASGEEIPCFALTGPDAGSDASAMPDVGIVCKGQHEGKEILGIRLTFNKRYITLAPVATVIGLAFKMLDPDGLLGKVKNLGITCALIPRKTPGVKIGRRHFPMGVAFQNGPIQGKDVFIPMDWIIGGSAMAGQGWRMLMECLAAGRAISLPSASMGGAKMLVYTAGAYTRIRRQFGVPIGQFEGIKEPLARIAGYTYIMEAARLFTAAKIDSGARPAVASAILKYHLTEFGRKIGNDAMDIHGGKGICMGPSNYIGRSWQSIPIAITVEGANILTRCLIIFGQGAMRCHPWIFSEFEAASHPDMKERLKLFDRALVGHIGYTLSNVFRSFFLSLTGGRLARAPRTKTRRFYQQATRFSAAFAFVSDMSLLLLGGSLKRRESLSARLGDILSYLYLLSAVLKHFEDQGAPAEDLPVVTYAAQICLYEIETSFEAFCQNYPSRIVGKLLKAWVLPWGKYAKLPSDGLVRKVANLLFSPTVTRGRLSEGAYITPNPNNMVGIVEEAFQKAIIAEPVRKMLHTAVRKHEIEGLTLEEQAKDALAKGIISPAEHTILLAANALCAKVIGVDDFTTEELLGHKILQADKIA